MPEWKQKKKKNEQTDMTQTVKWTVSDHNSSIWAFHAQVSWKKKNVLYSMFLFLCYSLYNFISIKLWTRGAWAPVSLHRPDISTMAEEVFNNYHSIPAFLLTEEKRYGKNLWEKKKKMVTTIFLVFHNNFYPFLYILVRFTNLKICCLQQVLSQTILDGETSKYRKYVL